MKDDKIGYQEQIIKELYLNAKERHGMEDDWGLVVKKLNSEIASEGPSTSSNSSSNSNDKSQLRAKKARADTLREKFEDKNKAPLKRVKSHR